MEQDPRTVTDTTSQLDADWTVLEVEPEPEDGVCAAAAAQTEAPCEDGETGDEEYENDSSSTAENSGTRLQRCEWPVRSCGLPDIFGTTHLLFYERFKAYQDYMLGDCKASEVRPFIADYLEKVVEPCDWLAIWSTDVFDVLVEVHDVQLRDMKACVSLVSPMQCDTRGCELTEEAMTSILEASQHRVVLQELQVVFEESGDFDQTALALEHLRFFFKHIWREWDEEDEDDFDYFVRCVEPRLRLWYDIAEDRVPTGLVEEYQSLLDNCSDCFQQFSVLRNTLNIDSDLELDNVSMVEGLKLYDQMETFKRKLRIIENPLLRYVLAYKGNGKQPCVLHRGPRPSGRKVIHLVAASCSTIQLQTFLSVKLMPLCSSEDAEIQFHREPVSALDSSCQGDTVVIFPGIYNVDRSIFIPDSIAIEGFGFPDEVVIEKRNKGDFFVETSGADVRISNIKFIQHDAIEGILCVRQGTLNIDNCVLQCDTSGVIVRSSARLAMNMCDLYGSKGAGVEIYPGSFCCLVGNGIHHCKDGVLVKDFSEEQDVMPTISMENNVIHNNEGYGVYLVKPKSSISCDKGAEDEAPPTAEAAATDDVSTPAPAPSSTNPPNSSTTADLQQESAGSDKVPSAGMKWHLTRQLSKTKETSYSCAVQDLTKHQIFVSIQGNQFRRNGMGDFGTFFY